MTNDRELLELAAKAAGIEISQWSNCQAGGFIAKGSAYLYSWGDKRIPRDFWNPLTDDGDALRLAVKLGINKGFCFAIGYPSAIAATSGGIAQEETIEADTDPYAATRRCITRAAAEIGKGMNDAD